MTDRSRSSNKVTQRRLREVLSYDPDSGRFTWLVTLGAKGPKGSIAGTTNPDGYRALDIDKQRYPEHWLAWFWSRGRWPRVQIDHINGIRDDNRISNLRTCTKRQNQQNRAPSKNKYAPGVYKTGRRYLSKIRAPNGVRVYLGSFSTVEGAANAYTEAKRRLHVFAPEFRQ